MDYTISVTVECEDQRWCWRIRCHPEPPIAHNFYAHMRWQVSELWVECCRVHRIRPSRFPLESGYGRYWCYDMPRSVMEQFITAAMGRGHTAAHIAQAIAQLCGQKLQPYTQGVGHATIGVSENFEAHAVQLAGPITPVLLSVNGRVYELSQTSESDIAAATLSDIEEQRLLMQQQYEGMVAQANQEQQRRIQVLEERLRQDVRMPVIGYDDVRVGMVVYSIGSNICTALPCSYRPKYVIRDNMRYPIHPDYYSTLWRDNLRLIIYTQGMSDECQLAGAYLLNDDWSNFHQYHESCLGNYRPPVPMRLPGHAYTVQEQVGRQLEIIDYGGLATDHPDGLPRTRELSMHVDFNNPVSDRYGNPVAEPVAAEPTSRRRRQRAQPEGATWTTE